MHSKVFKGLTRPPMLMGVPLTALVFICVFWVIVGFVMSLFFKYGLLASLLFLPSFFIAKDIAKKDDYAFRLNFLKFLTRGSFKGNKIFGANAFIGTQYHKPSKNAKKEFINMNLDIFDVSTYSKFIPYSTLIDDGIVMTKEGFMIASWRVFGVPFLTEEDKKLKQISGVLDILVRNLSESPVSFYKHTVRSDADNVVPGDFGDNEYLNTINNLYYDGLNKRNIKKTLFYFTLVYRPYEDEKERRKRTIEKNKDLMRYHIQEMKGYILTVDDILKDFVSDKLKSYKKEGRVYSEQLSFYNFLITHKWEEIKVTPSLIYNRLASVDIFFKKNWGEIEKNGESTFFKCIEIKDYENELETGFLDTLLCTTGDFVLTQSFLPLGKKEAQKKLTLQGNQLVSGETDAKSEVYDIEKIAKDELMSGNLSFGQYHFVLFVFGNSTKDVDFKTKEIGNLLGSLGFITSEAKIALEAAFWSQFPSNFKYRPRVPILSSKNFAHLGDFHNLPLGKLKGNCWGDAVTLLKTLTGQPYYFNFHISLGLNRDDYGKKLAGHTLILGSTGTGKTALMNFLFNQARKFAAVNSFPKNAKNKRFLSVYFDKGCGAMGNILASGGKYLRMKRGEPTGFAPFKCAPTPSNISFLNDLIKLIVTRNGATITAKQENEIIDAVRHVMDLPYEKRGQGITRVFSNLQEGNREEDKANSIKIRLKQWVKGGAYGHVFDNDDDLLDLDSNDIVGIDGEDFLEDPVTSAPIARYLVNRVFAMLDGRRGQLNIDEMWRYIEDPIIAKALGELLVTARKSDWFVVMGTQSPSQVLNNEFKNEIIEQTETYLFLPNEKARKEDYLSLGLSEKEYAIIDDLRAASRQFLVKKSDGATVCELDLSPLGDYLRLISTSKDDVPSLEPFYHFSNDLPKAIKTVLNNIK